MVEVLINFSRKFTGQGSNTSCTPPVVTSSQEADVVLNYLNRNTYKRDLAGMTEAWCTQVPAPSVHYRARFAADYHSPLPAAVVPSTQALSTSVSPSGLVGGAVIVSNAPFPHYTARRRWSWPVSQGEVAVAG